MGFDVSQTKLIAVAGIDGSGKSTLISQLAIELPGAICVTIWDALHHPEIASLIGFKDKRAVDSFLKQLHDPARAFFLFLCFSEALSRALEKKPKLILIDSYWYKYFSTELAMGANESVLRHCANVFPKPDLLFWIELPVEISTSRKQQISQYESGFSGVSDEDRKKGFIAFQTKSLVIMKQIMQENQAIVLSGESTIQDNLKTALETIYKSLGDL